MRFQIVLVSILFVVSATCQAQTPRENVVQASNNSSFENGLNQWQYQDLNAELVEQADEIGTTANVTAVKLTGNGGFGQFLTVGEGVEDQLLRSFAYTTDSQGNPGGSALVGAAYYDENWNEITKYEYTIRPKNIDDPFPLFSGYQTFGTYVPPNAVNIFLYVWSLEPGTQIVVDDLELLDVFVSTEPGANLILNGFPGFGLERFISDHPYNPALYESRSEFWSMDTASGEAMVFGSDVQNESAWQFVDLEPGVSYQLSFAANHLTSVGDVDGFSVGVDFFDSEWNLLDKQLIPIPAGTDRRGSIFINREIVPPAGSAAEVVWIYAPQTEILRPELPLLRVSSIILSKN